MSAVSESLSQLEVLVVDFQATGAAPHGHLLEMGWGRTGATTTDTCVRLIALPSGERIPPAVARLTGISERMARDGVDAHVAWRELSSVLVDEGLPAGTVAEFAELVFAYIDELSAASVAGHADERTTRRYLHADQACRGGRSGSDERSTR